MEESINRKALGYALKLLCIKNYSSFKISKKLRDKGFNKEDIDKVIEYCSERKYIDDEDYARKWINDRIKFKPMGRIRLIQELKEKGISEEYILSILEEIFDSNIEEQLIYRLLKQKFSKISDLDEKRKNKIFRFLLRRGFTIDKIRNVYNKYIKKN